jgi:sugar O-acyltransferase (sialic acid O-acetyltransferase NeuD family)
MDDVDGRLLILGARTLAAEIADLAADIPGLEVAAFVENMDPERCRETLEGLPIIWVDELPRFVQGHQAVCGLATTFRSRFVKQAAAHGLTFATLVHPSATISSSSSLGAGSIVSMGVIIASHTTIGRHVLINRGALVGHHTAIEDYVTIHPGANIAGACHIGEAAYIGMGATIIDHTKIGAHSVVGAGAVVTKDVPDNVLVVGVPAMIIKRNIPGK